MAGVVVEVEEEEGPLLQHMGYKVVEEVDRMQPYRVVVVADKKVGRVEVPLLQHMVCKEVVVVDKVQPYRVGEVVGRKVDMLAWLVQHMECKVVVPHMVEPYKVAVVADRLVDKLGVVGVVGRHKVYMVGVEVDKVPSCKVVVVVDKKVDKWAWALVVVLGVRKVYMEGEVVDKVPSYMGEEVEDTKVGKLVVVVLVG